jgi:beta-galactosidase
MAERYGAHPALEAWHVNNELACHVRHDYSEESAAAFRRWLRVRYGTIERLNEAWATAFWSQRYTAFEQVAPPRAMPTFPNPTQRLDWDRFSSDAWLGVYRAEAAILREVSPGVPITTNFMGFFAGADYWSWAGELDFVCDDHYPDPADPAAPAFAAMTRDLMRSLTGGGPWILMEQSSSAVNWRARNAPKPPGMHRNLSLQAVARGADGVMQFQWRQSAAGAEKFHSAMVPHAGEDSRVFRETVALGAELAALADVVGSRLGARVAIVFDWASWWTHEQQSMPARVDYVRVVFAWYRELWRRGALVDLAPADGDLRGYDVVVVPAAVTLSAGARAGMAAFARGGGRLVVGYQTGILDEDLHIAPGGYLGELREALGIRIEEFVPPAEPSMSGGPIPELRIDGLAAGAARDWGEVVHADAAEVLATFVGGMLHGMPAITRRAHGDGAAWYVATAPDGLAAVVDAVLDGTGIAPDPAPPADVEILERGGRRFVLNHGDRDATVDGEVVAARSARVVRIAR